ncbi:MAG: substrate-binding periplasmic protein [Terasakiella sp.]|uniref:substrate-binding periplasmic protein n=1 Tax=unclassified Terasakiella TaxID=2614952 RepID=UPI003B00F879
MTARLHIKRPLSLCLALLVCFYAWGMNDLHAQEKPPLRIATLPLPPWGYRTNDHISKGICYEWANAIAKRMERKSENRIVPMARLFKSLEYGKADFSIVLRTPYSEKITVPVVNVGIDFRTVVWPRKGIKINSYKDLQNLSLSVARGLKVGGKFEQQENLNIVPSMDYAHSMLLFKAGRVDAVVGTEQSLAYNAVRTGLSTSSDFDTPFELDRLQGWVQASNQYAQREGVDELKKAAQSLIDDGTFRQIYLKYQSSLVTLKR